MDLSLILVTYRSSAVAPAAVAAVRRQAAELGVAAEVILVDHSEDEAEAERLAALSPDRLLERPNRGFAAGLNAGIAVASGEILLLGNPDVELADGGLAALLAALGDGWEVVGPQFTLGPFRFPPADEQRPLAELARLRALRSEESWRRHMRREVRRWRAVWEAEEPVPQPTLSGALLALHRETAELLEPWPEDYFLYFEEVEWLRRANRRGLALAQVPAARARHAWGHSARPAEQAATFADSRRRFYHRCHGLAGALVLRLAEPAPPLDPPPLPPPDRLTDRLAERLADRLASRGAPAETAPAETAPKEIADPLLWLLSPSPRGFPAAGAELTADRVAAAVAELDAGREHGGPLLLTAWDRRRSRPLGVWRWTAGEGRE